MLTAGNLVATLSAGALNLNSATNAISQLGGITAPGGFNLTNGNTGTTVSSNISTTNNAVSINTGTDTYTQNNSVGISSGSGAITIIADAVSLPTSGNAFTTTGALTLKPSSAATTMSLAGSSTFNISAAEIPSITGGISGAGTITIGNSAASTGALTIGGAANFGSNILTLNAGSFTDTGASVITAGTLNLLARNSGGAIGASGASAIGVAATNLTTKYHGQCLCFLHIRRALILVHPSVGSGTLIMLKHGAGGA